MKKMIEEKDKELSQYKIIKKQFEPKKIFKENKVNLIKKKYTPMNVLISIIYLLAFLHILKKLK